MLSTVAKKPHHYIRLNRNFQSDLKQWAVFLSGWNGIRMIVAKEQHHYIRLNRNFRQTSSSGQSS